MKKLLQAGLGGRVPVRPEKRFLITSPDDASAEDRPRGRRLWPILLVVTLLYQALHFAWYGSTVFGAHPVLDSHEIIQLARNIIGGTLPSEPFYRAPLYAIIISPLVGLELTTEALLHAIRWINACCHAVSVLLLYAIAIRLWKHRATSFTIALLYGLYPVAIHFASDPFDITLAVTLMLAGVLFAVQAVTLQQGRRIMHITLAGVFWALGAITRAHLLPLVITWPILIGCTTRHARGRAIMAALAGPLLIYAMVGVMNLKISGDFRVMPLQGAYDLYAANRPGAHGRYMIQTREMKDEAHDVNPTRLESEILFMEATGAARPIDYRAVGAYWRGQALRNLFGHPVQSTRHMLRKAYYLLNNYEQYNNKTYSLHKTRSPWLWFNPLGWALFMSLGVGGLMLGRKEPGVRLIALIALVYAAGVALFYVSARFRLPLVPLLALLMGGWMRDCRTRYSIALPITIILMMVSFSSFGNVNDRRTYAEDYILMSRSALRLGLDDKAEEYASAAVELQPTRPVANKLLVLARYNLLVAGLPKLPPEEKLEDELERCVALKSYDDSMAFSAGIYLWLLEEPEEAVRTWRALVREDSNYMESALGALIATRRANRSERITIDSIPAEDKGSFLLIAEAMDGNEIAAQELARRLPPEHVITQAVAMQQLFRR